MNIEDTIDRFIDGETVDTTALDTALASREGRAYLIDILALRELSAAEPVLAADGKRGRTRVHLYARAAVIAVGLLGVGYAAGQRRAIEPPAAPPTTASIADAPEPMRVIELKSGVNWHETKGGD